ncbi:hypothetical protein SOM61_22395 [Massilia sp. CFBP9012]|uniref:hypothetical protein n=1 Tax=Massilia sp. CFBP9012 TaxID=3096531 RepID=UPI002A69BD5E|nr:hypothetical protein [Massilia sp. CFBP9012]MDY0977716.1 hypothetical protein [Massilia sp. CFBP9012]
MPNYTPIFSKEELGTFIYDLHSKLRAGLRSVTGVLYLVLTLVGVAWASYAIPAINGSDTSAETLGIYVIGVLIAVTLDSFVYLVNQGGSSESNSNGRVIAGICFGIGFLLIVWASFLSIAVQPEAVPNTASLKDTAMASAAGVTGTVTAVTDQKRWRWGAHAFLILILLIAILMSLILTGIDTGLPKISSIQRDVDALKDKV